METNLLQKKLDSRAKEKIEADIRKLFQNKQTGFDFVNTFIEIKDITNAAGNAVGIRLENLIDVIEKSLIVKYLPSYIEIETNNFLNKVDAINEDLNQLRSELNL